MLINGEEQIITAEPLSSGPLMSIEVPTIKGSIIKELTGNTMVTYVKSDSEKIQGLVVGWNEIITDDGNIILPVGSRVKIETGETGSLVKRFEGDILYTAEDLRELNSKRFPSGFALKGLESEKIFTLIENKINIAPCSGMVDGIMFSMKKPAQVEIITGEPYFRIDSVVIGYDSEKNRVSLYVKRGESFDAPERAKAPDLIERHLGTYEIRVCDVKVTDFMLNLNDDDIIDRRDLLRPDTAKDILFDDEYLIIENDKEKNVHNALIKIHENALDEIDNRKIEDEKIVTFVDVEREERKTDNTKTNERIDNLKAEDISYYNTGLMPDDGTSTVEPNVQDALDAMAGIVVGVNNDNTAIRKELQDETKERVEFDTIIQKGIDDVKHSNESLNTRVDNVEKNNTQISNSLNNELGIINQSINALILDINKVNNSIKTLNETTGKLRTDVDEIYIILKG